MPKEKEVIAEYYRAVSGNHDIEKQDVSELIGKHDDVRIPDFKKSAAKIKDMGQYPSIINAAMQTVAASKADPAQDEAIAILSK